MPQSLQVRNICGFINARAKDPNVFGMFLEAFGSLNGRPRVRGVSSILRTLENSDEKERTGEIPFSPDPGSASSRRGGYPAR